MFNVFSTREIASTIYVILLVVWLLSRQNGSKLISALLKSAFKKVFLVPITCLLLFAALLVYGLQFAPFWNWLLLKDVILWVLFVATPICFKASTRKLEIYPFRSMITENFLWSAILEFFIGTFTFSFIMEMIVVPVFTFIAILKDHDRENPIHKEYQKVYDNIAALAGLLLLLFTVDVAIDVIAVNGIVNVLISFCIPIIFSIAFLPLMYLLALKAKYHDLFIRMRIRNNTNHKELKEKKSRVFYACGLSYRKVTQFEVAYSQYIRTIHSANDDDTFLSFVDDFKHT